MKENASSNNGKSPEPGWTMLPATEKENYLVFHKNVFEIHAKTIEALEHLIKDEEIRKRLLGLLKDARDMYYSAERLKERILPTLLRRGKQERSKAQYYSEDYSKLRK